MKNEVLIRILNLLRNFYTFYVLFNKHFKVIFNFPLLYLSMHFKNLLKSINYLLENQFIYLFQLFYIAYYFLLNNSLKYLKSLNLLYFIKITVIL